MLANNIKDVAGALFAVVQMMSTVHAEDFTSTAQSSYEDNDAETACRIAFRQAETEAMKEIDDFFAKTSTTHWRTELIQQRETRTVGLNGKTRCSFYGTWLANSENTLIDLIGIEQSIEGEYHASCSRDHQRGHCWSQIVAQAEQDLRNQLREDYGNLRDIQLQYLDFEGRDREHEGRHYIDRTATGIFYFRVNEATTHIEQAHPSHQDHSFSTMKPIPIDSSSFEIQQDKRKKKKAVDVTLSYTWDHNNRAEHNDVAISSDRWGIGIWTNNQIGFAAFLGADTVGIGDTDGKVNNDSGDYSTLGIGIGHRLFDNHAVTIENMIYYVDSAPYKKSIAPRCKQCEAKSFQSENYFQATSNIKTNTHGVNIGWMFTWKWLERQSDLNHWSSGFYLELQL